MDEREEWIQKYIQKQIGGMVFGSEVERQIVTQKAREQAEMYLQMHQGQAQGNPQQPQSFHEYFGKSARWFQSPKPLTPQETVGAIIRQKITGSIGTISGKSGGGFAIFVPAEGSIYRILFTQINMYEVIGRER